LIKKNIYRKIDPAGNGLRGFYFLSWLWLRITIIAGVLALEWERQRCPALIAAH